MPKIHCREHAEYNQSLLLKPLNPLLRAANHKDHLRRQTRERDHYDHQDLKHTLHSQQDGNTDVELEWESVTIVVGCVSKLP